MPLLQPIRWGKGRKDDFRDWIHKEISNTIGDRNELETKWENILVQHRAQLPDVPADFPFPGAPDVEFPLTDIHYQPVYADFMQTFHAPEDYWTPTAKRPDRVDAVGPLREGLSAIEKRFLKMRRVNGRVFQDMVLLGTGVYKNHWHAGRKTVRDYNALGKIERITKRWSQPQILPVPLQRFYFPAYAWSIDPDDPGGAPWVAEKHSKRAAQLRVWANGSESLPGFDREALERVLKFEIDRQEKVDEEQRRLDNFRPFQDLHIDVWEIPARFDVDGDGVEEDILVIYHHESQEILRAIYKPFLHGKHQYNTIQYLPGPGVLGVGIGDQDAWAQEMVTILLNAQLANVLLANTRMYSAPLGSNIQPGEPVYPGKIWMVGPNEQIGEIRLADIYQSLPQIIGQMLQFAEMRTAVSELRQGNLTGLPSRTPATSLLSILREGNKRFDMILANSRDAHSEMGLRLLQNVAQHVHEDPTRWETFFRQALGDQDAMTVLDVLEGSIAEIEESFGVEVTATSAQVNKEVEKQSFIGLMQILGQVGSQLIQVAQIAQTSPPGTPMHEVGVALFTGGVEMMKQLIARFDIQNPSDYLGNLEAIAQGLAAQSAGGNVATSQLGSLFGPATEAPPQIVAQQQLGGILGI